jgi:hypothetical protein
VAENRGADPSGIAMAAKLAEMHPEWGIDIKPPPAGPSSGAVRQQGGSGLVRYVWRDGDRGRYLEYYSFHRIWGDLHVRIHESGEVEWLPTLTTTFIVPDEDAAAREKLHKENQDLLQQLDEAGLLSGGPVPMSFQINSAIMTGAIDPEARPEVADETE